MPNLYPTKLSYTTGNSTKGSGVVRSLKRKISTRPNSICAHNANTNLPNIFDAEDEKDKNNFICIQARLGYVLFRVLGGTKLEEYGYPDKSIIEILNIVLIKANTEVTEENSGFAKKCDHCDNLYLDKKQLKNSTIKSRIDVLKSNIARLLRVCVPDQEKWTEFGWDGKSVEEILEELSTGFVANDYLNLTKK